MRKRAITNQLLQEEYETLLILKELMPRCYQHPNKLCDKCNICDYHVADNMVIYYEGTSGAYRACKHHILGKNIKTISREEYEALFALKE